MYRELVEHPQFVPDAARGAVDFRRWHDRGRIWRVRPKSTAAPGGRRPSLGKAGVPELVGLLGHPNGWWRMTAQRLLVERQDRAVVPLLIATLEGHAQSPGAASCPLGPGGSRAPSMPRSWGVSSMTLIPACASKPCASRRRIEAHRHAATAADLDSDRAGRRPRDPGPTPGGAGAGRSLP